MKSRFLGVQLLRAFAAILVVIWHVGDMAEKFTPVRLAGPRFLHFGYAGVDIFFAISGFIICHIALSKPFHWQDFARKRILRIYPFYAFFTLLAVVVWALNLGWTISVQTPTIMRVIKSLLIFPTGFPLLFVGWSLEYEVQFYILATLLFGLGFPRLLPLVLLAMFLAGAALDSTLGQMNSHLFTYHQLEFALGAIVYFERDRIRAMGWLIPLLGATALFAATAWDFTTAAGRLPSLLGFPTRDGIGYSVGSALFLISALNANFASWGGLSTRILAAGVYLGDASYILYLSHLFVLAVIVRVGMYLGVRDFGVYTVLIMAFLAACGFAVIFHALIERPLLAFFETSNRQARWFALPRKALLGDSVTSRDG